MHTKRDPKHLVVTNLCRGRDGDTLYVRPFSNCNGFRFESFEIASDVEVSEDMKAWIHAEIASRIVSRPTEHVRAG